MRSKKDRALYVRNFVFGVEDSLVSTVGLISGIASAGVSRKDILITGVVLVFVEAFSMASGSFLSEHSAEEYEDKKNSGTVKPVIASFVMFVSYFISGFIPLSPYIFFERQIAFSSSIIFSLVALFVLGAVGAKLFRISLLRHAIEMLVVGGVAIAVGVIVGYLLSQ